MLRKQVIRATRNYSGRIPWSVYVVRRFATRFEEEYEIDLISMKRTKIVVSEGFPLKGKTPAVNQVNRVDGANLVDEANENVNGQANQSAHFESRQGPSQGSGSKKESKNELPLDLDYVHKQDTTNRAFTLDLLLYENITSDLPRIPELDSGRIIYHFSHIIPRFPQYLKFTKKYSKELETFLQFVSTSYDGKITRFSQLTSLEILNSLYIFKSLYSQGKLPEVVNIEKYNSMWNEFSLILSADTTFPNLLTKYLLPFENGIISLYNSGISNFKNELEHLEKDFDWKKLTTLGDLLDTINKFLVDFDSFLLASSDYLDEEKSTFLSVILQVNRYKSLKSILDKHTSMPIGYLNVVLEDTELEELVKKGLQPRTDILLDEIVPYYDFLTGIPGFKFSNYKEFVNAAALALEANPVIAQRFIIPMVRLFTCGWISTDDHPVKFNHKFEVFDFGLDYEGNYYNTQYVRSLHNKNVAIIPLDGTGAEKAAQYGRLDKPFRFLEEPISKQVLRAYAAAIEEHEVDLFYKLQARKNDYYGNNDDIRADFELLIQEEGLTYHDFSVIKEILEDFGLQGKHQGSFQLLLDDLFLIHGLKWFHPVERYFLETPELLTSLREMATKVGDFGFVAGDYEISNVVDLIKANSELGPMFECLLGGVLSPRHLQNFLVKISSKTVPIEMVPEEVATEATATSYHQLPEELELHKFAPELVILRKSLDNQFANVPAVDILAKLDDCVNARYGARLPRKTAAKLSTRLTALFTINGGDTTILDTLLHSQSVFDSFEAKKSEAPKPYRQIPDSFLLHEYTAELSELKALLGDFKNVSSDTILKKVEELAFNSTAYAKLYRNLVFLFKHNNNSTFALDTAMHANEVFLEFEKKQSKKDLSLIGENSRLINELYPYIVQFMDELSLGAKAGIWSNTENEFAATLEEFKARLDNSHSEFPIYLNLVDQLANFNREIKYYPNFLQHLYEIKGYDVGKELSGADVELIYKAFIRNLEYEEEKQLEHEQQEFAKKELGEQEKKLARQEFAKKELAKEQERKLAQQEVVRKELAAEQELSEQLELEQLEKDQHEQQKVKTILSELNKATVAAETLAQQYKYSSDRNDGLNSTLGSNREKSAARGQLAFRSADAKSLAEESGIVALQLAAKTVNTAASVLENALDITEWEEAIIDIAGELTSTKTELPISELQELVAEISELTNKMLAQSVVVSMATQGTGIAAGLTSTEVEKLEGAPWLIELQLDAQKYALRALKAAEATDLITQKSSMRALEEQEKANQLFDDYIKRKELAKARKAESKARKTKTRLKPETDVLKATVVNQATENSDRRRVNVPVTNIEPSTFKMSDFNGVENIDVGGIKVENYKPKGEQVVAEEFSSLDQFEQDQAEIRDALSIALNGTKRNHAEPVEKITKRENVSIPRSNGTVEHIDKPSIESFLENAKKAKDLDRESQYREAQAYEWSKSLRHSHKHLNGRELFSHTSKKDSELFPTFDLEYILMTVDGHTVSTEIGVEHIATNDIFKILDKLDKKETELFIKNYKKLQRKGWKLCGVRNEDSKKFLILRRHKANLRSRFFSSVKSLFATTGVILASLVGIGYLLEEETTVEGIPEVPEWDTIPEHEPVELIEVPEAVTSNRRGLFWK